MQFRDRVSRSENDFTNLCGQIVEWCSLTIGFVLSLKSNVPSSPGFTKRFKLNEQVIAIADVPGTTSFPSTAKRGANLIVEFPNTPSLRERAGLKPRPYAVGLGNTQKSNNVRDTERRTANHELLEPRMNGLAQSFEFVGAVSRFEVCEYPGFSKVVDAHPARGCLLVNTPLAERPTARTIPQAAYADGVELAHLADDCINSGLKGGHGEAQCGSCEA